MNLEQSIENYHGKTVLNEKNQDNQYLAFNKGFFSELRNNQKIQKTQAEQKSVKTHFTEPIINLKDCCSCHTKVQKWKNSFFSLRKEVQNVQQNISNFTEQIQLYLNNFAYILELLEKNLLKIINNKVFSLLKEKNTTIEELKYKLKYSNNDKKIKSVEFQNQKLKLQCQNMKDKYFQLLKVNIQFKETIKKEKEPIFYAQSEYYDSTQSKGSKKNEKKRLHSRKSFQLKQETAHPKSLDKIREKISNLKNKLRCDLND